MRQMRLRGRSIAVWCVWNALLGGVTLARAEQAPKPDTTDALPPAAGASSPSPAPPAAGASSPSPSPAPPAAGEPKEAPKKRSVARGYSWSEAPKSSRARGRVRPIDFTKPLVTYPGFRMLADGRSEVWLRCTRAVTVTTRRGKNEIVYLIGDAQVGVQNNTNPLVTTHFNTPISRAFLRRVQRGAELVVRLREPVEPTYSTKSEPGGMILLRVLVDKAAGDYASGVLLPGPEASSPSADPPAGQASPTPPLVLPETGPQL